MAPDETQDLPPAPDSAESEDDGEEFSLLALLKRTYQYGFGEAGPRLWKYSGAASAKSVFPLILVNHLRAGIGGD